MPLFESFIKFVKKTARNIWKKPIYHFFLNTVYKEVLLKKSSPRNDRGNWDCSTSIHRTTDSWNIEMLLKTYYWVLWMERTKHDGHNKSGVMILTIGVAIVIRLIRYKVKWLNPNSCFWLNYYNFEPCWRTSCPSWKSSFPLTYPSVYHSETS